MSSKTRYIIAVIANDAVEKDGRYLDVGPNFKRRLRDAIYDVETRLPTADIVWAFGAGTDEAHANGPTLAMLSEACLRTVLPQAVTLTNREHKEYYGTLEEIYWVVKRAGQTWRNEKLHFVFYTQARHKPRVKKILRDFHGDVTAHVHVTGQTTELSLRDELRSFVRLWAIKRGFVKRRFETTYRL